MKRILMASAAVLLMATSAQAEPKVLSRSGAWTTFYTVNDTNIPMCGMSIEGHLTGGATRLFVKYNAGGDKLFIQIYNDGWRIPENTEIPGYIVFDTSPRFPFTANGGMSSRTRSGVVTLSIAADAALDFLHEFSEAKKIIIGFDSGTQTPMELNMQGSRDAANVFKRCNASIDEAAAKAPQPFAKKDTPQPFDNATGQKSVVKKKDDGSI